MWKYCVLCLNFCKFSQDKLNHNFECILFESNISLENNETCEICLLRKQIVCFLPCRHVCCHICAAFFNTCPFCRQSLQQFCRFFIPSIKNNCIISTKTKFFYRLKSFLHFLDFHSSVEYSRKGYYCNGLYVVCAKCNISQYFVDEDFRHRLNCPLSKLKDLNLIKNCIDNVECLNMNAHFSKCAICFVNDSNCILLPCSHLCVCFVCFTLENSLNCPVCVKPYCNSVTHFFTKSV